MKQLISIFTLIFVIIAGWILIYTSVEKDTLYFVNALTILNEDIEESNWEIANNNFLKIKKQWNQVKGMWVIFLDHHELHNIDLSLSKADQYIKSKNTPLSLGEIAALQELFCIIKEHEALTISNIL